MTQFVQAGSSAGILYLPAEHVSPVPIKDGPWRDQELLALPDEQIARLDDQDCLDALGAARRQRAKADALELRALARLQQLRGDDAAVAEEARLELRVSRHQAANRIGVGAALVDRMPRVLEAMARGEHDSHLARRLADATLNLADEHAREVDRRIAPKLGGIDPTRIVRAARRIVQQVDPDGAVARARTARDQRHVALIAREDAMSTLTADLPAEMASSAYSRIDGLARKLRNSGDPRNLDQLRADVYASLLLGQDPGVAEPKAAATIFIHVPVDAALGLSDDGCELDGYGPLPAPIARDIMTNHHSVWRKVLTDPASGAPLDVGRTRYRPTQAIRDYVAVRDRECSYCHRPAARCDFDHLDEAVRHHGPTSADNAGPKCEPHHYLKVRPDWQLDYTPTNGTTTITTPANRQYELPQEPPVRPPPKAKPKPDESTKDPLSDRPPY